MDIEKSNQNKYTIEIPFNTQQLSDFQLLQKFYIKYFKICQELIDSQQLIILDQYSNHSSLIRDQTGFIVNEPSSLLKINQSLKYYQVKPCKDNNVKVLKSFRFLQGENVHSDLYVFSVRFNKKAKEKNNYGVNSNFILVHFCKKICEDNQVKQEINDISQIVKVENNSKSKSKKFIIASPSLSSRDHFSSPEKLEISDIQQKKQKNKNNQNKLIKDNDIQMQSIQLELEQKNAELEIEKKKLELIILKQKQQLLQQQINQSNEQNVYQKLYPTQNKQLSQSQSQNNYAPQQTQRLSSQKNYFPSIFQEDIYNHFKQTQENNQIQNSDQSQSIQSRESQSIFNMKKINLDIKKEENETIIILDDI